MKGNKIVTIFYSLQVFKFEVQVRTHPSMDLLLLSSKYNFDEWELSVFYYFWLNKACFLLSSLLTRLKLISIV